MLRYSSAVTSVLSGLFIVSGEVSVPKNRVVGRIPSGVISGATVTQGYLKTRLNSTVAVSPCTLLEVLFTELLSTRLLAAQSRY